MERWGVDRAKRGQVSPRPRQRPRKETNMQDDDLEGLTEMEELAKLVSRKRPRRNKRAEVEKKSGDQKRSSLKMTEFGPLPVQLRGYAIDVVEADRWPADDHVRQRQREIGDVDLLSMIDRVASTKPPESKPSIARKNKEYVAKRKKATRKFKARKALDKKKKVRRTKSPFLVYVNPGIERR